MRGRRDSRLRHVPVNECESRERLLYEYGLFSCPGSGCLTQWALAEAIVQRAFRQLIMPMHLSCVQVSTWQALQHREHSEEHQALEKEYWWLPSPLKELFIVGVGH